MQLQLILVLYYGLDLMGENLSVKLCVFDYCAELFLDLPSDPFLEKFLSKNCLELLKLCDSRITLVLASNLVAEIKLKEVSFS